MKAFWTAVASAAFAVGASAAGAATITYDSYISTNAAHLSPTVTVDDSPVGGFLVSVYFTDATEEGHLNLIAFDIGSSAFTSSDVSSVKNTLNASPFTATTLSYQSVCNNTGPNQASAGKYCFGTDVPVGGNSNDLSGLTTPDFDFVLAFYNNDAIARQGTTLTFLMSDLGGTITLDDFGAVGLRYQSSNNGCAPTAGLCASDKLLGNPRKPDDPPPTVPVPAAGFLLLGGIGGLVALRRKKA